jgi:F0F1-type ATP synthase assembly protein I
MTPGEPPDKKNAPVRIFGSSMREAGPYFSLGIEITISMVFFLLLGYFADGWFGTSPWLLIVGIVLSVVATGATLYRVVREMDRASAAKKAEKAAREAREGGGATPGGPRA